MKMNDDYLFFLRNKVKLAEQFGFDVADHEVNPILKPHQRDMVRWMVRMGRAACFAAFGLGKSVIQLEAVRLTLERVGGIMSVPYRAILKGRKAIATELSPRYFMDGAHYLKSAENEISMPGLFDTLEADKEAA